MSISLVNSSFAASYALELDGVDGISVLARTLAGSVAEDGTVALELSDGKMLKGILHASLTVLEAKRIVGRTLDLDSAYKQLLVRQSSLWRSVLQVMDTEGTSSPRCSPLERLQPFTASTGSRKRYRWLVQSCFP